MTDIINLADQRFRKQTIGNIEKALDSYEAEGIDDLRKRRDRLRVESFVKLCVEVCNDELEKIRACVGHEAVVAVIDALAEKHLTKKDQP